MVGWKYLRGFVQSKTATQATVRADPMLLLHCLLMLGASLDVQALPTTSHVRFLENRGQWPSDVRYLARCSNMLVRAEGEAIILQVPDPAGDPALGVLVRIELAGPTHDLQPRGEQVQSGAHHYLIGDDPSVWTRNVSGFARVKYPCVADGIDLVLREERGMLEYDLEVSAGADLSGLAFQCTGIDGLSLGDDGSLLMHTALGVLRQSRPRSEEILRNGERRKVDVRFRLIDEHRFGFESPRRDRNLALYIDPGLVWATYLGCSSTMGGGEAVIASAVDASGCVIVTGWANAFDFPTTPGAMVALPPGGSVVFVTKLDATGNLVYSTTIGSHTGGSRGLAVALDSLGRATVSGVLFNGTLFTSDFPTTQGAFDTVMSSANTAGFVLRLSDLGDQLVFSTFIEGSNGGSEAHALDVSSTGATVVGGYTVSSTFPVTPGAFKSTYVPLREGFVTRLDPTGAFLEWSTFLGGSNDDDVIAVEVDEDDFVTAVGFTRSSNFPFTSNAFNRTIVPSGGCFITRLNPQGSALVWSTAFAGTTTATFNGTSPKALALEPGGSLVIIGSSGDPSLPVTPGALFQPYPSSTTLHPFVARIDGTGSTLLYSTFLSFAAELSDVVVDASGVATVSGFDPNGMMPTTPGAYDSTSTPTQAFLSKINPTGTRLYYSTHFGGTGSEGAVTLAALDSHRVVFGGGTQAGLPVTAGSFDQTYNGGLNDGYVAVLDLLLQGTRAYGDSTPSCRGDLTMNVTRMPSAGAADFGFYCSGAPPSSFGWLILGTEASSPTPSHGASIWLDVTRRIARIAVQSDANGFVETPLPLTGFGSGIPFAAQYFFLNTSACSGQGPFSASHGLRIDVQ